MAKGLYRASGEASGALPTPPQLRRCPSGGRCTGAWPPGPGAAGRREGLRTSDSPAFALPGLSRSHSHSLDHRGGFPSHASGSSWGKPRSACQRVCGEGTPITAARTETENMPSTLGCQSLHGDRTKMSIFRTNFKATLPNTGNASLCTNLK